jgi:hypothetical protein
MIRKPTSGDSEQRQHESERARQASTLSAGGMVTPQPANWQERRGSSRRPMHGSAEGESAHGAIPRQGIEYEQGD